MGGKPRPCPKCGTGSLRPEREADDELACWLCGNRVYTSDWVIRARAEFLSQYQMGGIRYPRLGGITD